jgi:hypothetical protein
LYADERGEGGRGGGQQGEEGEEEEFAVLDKQRGDGVCCMYFSFGVVVHVVGRHVSRKLGTDK